MSDQIKSFISLSFSVIGIVALVAGLYYLGDKGWDYSKYYFFTGAGLSLIAQAIEFSRSQIQDDDY